MKVLLLIVAPIISVMLGMHLVAQAAPVPKTITHNTPACKLKGKLGCSSTI